MRKRVVTEGLGAATLFALPWRVAQDEGLFAEEGLTVEFKAPLIGANSPQVLPAVVEDHRLVDSIRSHSPFEEGLLDIYAACEWGQIRRALDSRRGGKILGKRSCIAPMAIFSAPGSRFTHPQSLSHQPVSVSFHNGNHYATLMMLEGFLARDEIKVVCQHHVDGYEAVRRGEVAAIALTEPMITVAEKQGFQRIIETHFLGSEIGAPEFDGGTYEAIVRALEKAIRRIDADKKKYLHYLIEAIPEKFRGVVSPEDFHLPRLRYVDPEPYTREEFEKTYAWMVGWGLIASGATYEQLVDCRIAVSS